MIGRFVAEVTAIDVITAIRTSKVTNTFSNFKVSHSTGTNQLINCFSDQILSLLKIAFAALVQIVLSLVNISPN